MGRVFNTTGVCIPEKHYMVNINGRLQQIRVLVDEGKYFTINRARQYGKTTTLRALAEMLRDEYYVASFSFMERSSPTTALAFSLAAFYTPGRGSP